MITRRRVVVSVLIALALAGFYAAYLSRGENEQPVLRDDAVRLVRPTPGDRVLRQSEIYVELDADYTGILIVESPVGNPIEIPPDQLDRTVGLNAVAFTPGDDKEIEQLRAGTNCARVVLWRINESRAQSRPYSWCFDVH